MVHMTAVPRRRQTSCLIVLLGCLIVYAMFIISHSTQQVTFGTTISDQPTTHKLLEAPQQKVITTASRRSPSRTSDQELRHNDQAENERNKRSEIIRTKYSAISASDPILEEKNSKALSTISNETELGTQILPEETLVSTFSHSTINGISDLEQAVILKVEEDGIDPVAWSKLKIAVFMTTHLSEKHLRFLHKCWPYASGYLPLLQNSHLILYTSNEPPQADLDRMQFKSVTVRRYVDPPLGGNETENEKVKQMGAKRAMVDPFLKENRWFDGFDWVIRLNPDVLIRRDTWIRHTMLNTSVDGIFVDYSSRRVGRLQSDFYAFRPSAANDTALIDNFHVKKTAEMHLYSGFSDSIRRKRVAWLPGARTRRNWARLIGTESPVIHFHAYVKKCPHYFNATYSNIY
jgi:hypothetical protein